MYCHKCGKEISTGDKFCNNCGVAIDETTRDENLEPSKSKMSGKVKKLLKFALWIGLIILAIWLIIALGPLWIIAIILLAILFVIANR